MDHAEMINTLLSENLVHDAVQYFISNEVADVFLCIFADYLDTHNDIELADLSDLAAIFSDRDMSSYNKTRQRIGHIVTNNARSITQMDEEMPNRR